MADQEVDEGKTETVETSSSKVDFGALEAAHDAMSAEENAPAGKETAAEDTQPTETTDPTDTDTPKEPLTDAEIQAKIDDAYNRGRNATSSNLGRQLQAMEKKLDSKLEEFSQGKNQAEESEDDDEEVVLTKKELKDYTKNIARETAREDLTAAQKKETDYESGYVQKAGELVAEYDSDPATRDGICALFIDKFNVKRSGKGLEDAELNFAKAEAAFFKSKSKAKVNPLKGKDPITPLDNGGGGKVIKKNAQVIQLKTPEAIEFANQFKLSEETIKRALAR